jgi:hypothetical protein
MIGFLRRWLSGQSRRRIFRYFDGRSWRWADPIVLQRELDKAGGDGWTHHLDILRLAAKPPLDTLSPTLADEQNKAAEEAIEALAAIVRKAFSVQPVNHDGDGLAEAECISLLAQFLGWMSEAEADARPFRSSPGSMESRPANSTIG